MSTDFDGCRRACRKQAVHTRVWGECEHGDRPEPTVSMTMVYTDPEDGLPSIGFDTYTVDQLAELIEPAINRPVDGWANPYSEAYGHWRARQAAHAIIHRDDKDTP